MTASPLALNHIYNENCLDTMQRMPNQFIDLALTSPPYDNLRDYKSYFFEFEKIAIQLFRILKNGGVLVWVVGDQTIKGSETGTSFKQALFFKEIGFNLHDTMIYQKSGTPYPSKIRYYPCFEYMFILSKGKPKTINLIKDRKNKWDGSWGKITKRQKSGAMKISNSFNNCEYKNYGIRFNIWKYNTGYNFSSRDKIAFQHPAIFPEKLAADHILSWSNENDLVYDPFMGSGTTAKMAIKLKRKFIGSEIAKEYINISGIRIEEELKQIILI